MVDVKKIFNAIQESKLTYCFLAVCGIGTVTWHAIDVKSKHLNKQIIKNTDGTVENVIKAVNNMLREEKTNYVVNVEPADENGKHYYDLKLLREYSSEEVKA